MGDPRVNPAAWILTSTGRQFWPGLVRHDESCDGCGAHRGTFRPTRGVFRTRHGAEEGV